MNFEKTNSEDTSGFDADFQNFCLGVSTISSVFFGAREIVSAADAFIHDNVIEDRWSTDIPSERRREFEELEEELTVDEGVAGGKRFHPVTTSPPTTTPVSQLHDPDSLT
jgi:hypothetical protein